MLRPEKIYECKLVNKSDREWCIVEANARPMMILQPGEEHVLYSHKPSCLYSRFNLIRRNGDGSVTVKENADWPRPEFWAGKHLTTFVNESPVELQAVLVNSEPVYMPFGIPMPAVVDLDEPQWIWYEKVVIKQIEEKVRDKERPQYWLTQVKTIEEKTPRSDAELKKIKGELDALAVKRADLKIIVPNDIKSKLK